MSLKYEYEPKFHLSIAYRKSKKKTMLLREMT